MTARRTLECALVLYGCLLFARSGNAQQCIQNITIGGVDTSAKNVNTSVVPTCFVCLDFNGVPTNAIRFELGSSTIGLNVNVTLEGSLLIVSDFTSLGLMDGQSNIVGCIDTNVAVYESTIFTLNPIQPVYSMPNEPFYVEDSNVTVVCVNRNTRVFRGTTSWTDPSGALVGSGGTLEFIAMRSEAGRYTCAINLADTSLTGVDVPSQSFDLIVHYPPEVSTTNTATKTIDINTILNLECSFVGIPLPTVEWMQNGLPLNNSNDSITVTIDATETSMLQWTNVPVEAAGTFYCVVMNNLGSVNTSINVLIRTRPDPASNLRVGEVTETSIEIFWMKEYNGLTDITGANIMYFIVGDAAGARTASADGSDVSFVISGLTSFANYNISLAVRNRLGASDPVSITQQTQSRILTAPTVTLTSVSSTEILLSWTPPTPDNTTEAAFYWKIEFSRMDDPNPTTEVTVASTTNFNFMGLDKGTFYRARVAGNNSRGFGNFSDYAMNETLVDPPSSPINVTAEALSSFAINITWQPPVDNGGRMVTSYQVKIINATTDTVVITKTVTDKLYCLVNDMTNIMGSTEYTVMVRAGNTMGLGMASNVTITTIDITLPQPVLKRPVTMDSTNISSTLTWTFPGGEVDFYFIMVVGRVTPESFNVTVNGTETSVVLMDLDPASTYAVTIITQNSIGDSIASPIILFTTAPPPDPVITISPPGPYMIGDEVVLTCTSPDDDEIMWTKRNGPNPLNPFVFVQEGEMFRSTLTIKDIRESNSGIYECRVGETSSNITVSVLSPTVATTAEPSGISTMVIIIAACVGGVGGLFLLVIISIGFFLCCYYFVCKRSNSKPKKSGLKPTKRGKELFDISNTYFTPTTNTGIAKNTDVTFAMPEEYQTHSSFNTLEKQNKIDRSHSPEAREPTSFGGAERYQDMPVPPGTGGGSDGTLL